MSDINGSVSIESDILRVVQENGKQVLFKRWGATVIDFIIVIGVFLACTGLSFMIGEETYNSIKPLVVTLWAVLLVLYYWIPESLTGSTVGKYICRIRVTDAYGKPPGLKKGLTRTLLRLIEVNPFLLGGVPAGLLVLFNKKRQRLGDMAAGTYVISVKDIPTQHFKRRYYILSAGISVLAVLAFLVSCIGFLNHQTAENQKEATVPHTIMAKSGTWELTQSEGYIDALSTLESGTSADLFIANLDMNAYIMGYTETLPAGSIDLISEAQQTADNMKSSSEFELTTGMTEIKIDEYPAVQFEGNGKLEGKPAAINVTLIQGKNNLYRIVSFSHDADKESALKSIRAEISSFQETEK